MKKEIASILTLLLLGGTVCSSAQEMVIGKSITTDYPTKYRVVSDFTVTDFGAKAEPGFDNRNAFQNAIDAAYRAGGGVVYVPSGNYEFKSTSIGTRNVRVRSGQAQEMKEFPYEYVLKLHPGVQLRGDWADPSTTGGKVKGTILEVRVGKDSPNADGNVESWWNDSQAGNALRTTYTSVADRFIEMNASTGVTNLSIWYPEQDINDVRPYPWTLYQASGDCATLERVTLVNSYNGFLSTPTELHYVLESNITALNKAIEVHVCTDIGRIENVHIGPSFWANSGLKGAPSLSDVTAYTKTHATGFKMHRSDWEYVSHLYVSGCKEGMWIGREPGFQDAPNAQLYEIHIDGCGNGLYVEDVNPYGILVSNSSFNAAGNDNAVYFDKDFHTSVQFNGVDFNGAVVSDGKAGVVSFESCRFSDYSGYALKINSGNALLSQCDFGKTANHIYLGENTNTMKAVNSGCRQKLDVTNKSRNAVVDIRNGKEYAFTPIPKNITTNIAKHPSLASDNVLRAQLACASGYNNDRPTKDVSADLQHCLDRLKAAGGGTLYLPAGRYLVEHPIVVPSGVELRGSFDVQHHTQGGGTAIFTNYDGGAAGEQGASLIQLEAGAGLRGITLAQINIISDGATRENPRRTPFMIQGLGPDVYAVNVNFASADKGIDLASHNTSGHYVDYLSGMPLRAGIWVGGGAKGGFIRNMQFNPHYGSRLPQGGQGYVNAFMNRFVQSNCSALKFGDVKDETVFNNFVYGSIYGLHFLKDAVTGKCPGKMTVIGHGSDGCTFSMFVEDADKNTNIVAINSELVNTRIQDQPVRSYVLMGSDVNTKEVNPNARLVLYNSAFWGSPVYGAIVNNGNVSINQGNFTHSGRGIEVRGGNAKIFTTYFQEAKPDPEAEKAKMEQRRKAMEERMARNGQHRKNQSQSGQQAAQAWAAAQQGWSSLNAEEGINPEDFVYVKLYRTAKSLELTNNFYQSGTLVKKEGGTLYGTDIK